jgi:hypothetical protein
VEGGEEGFEVEFELREHRGSGGQGGRMGKLVIRSYTISADGYGAGPRQTLETPLGEGGEELHEWMVGTKTFIEMYGGEGGTTGLDDEFTS